MNNSNKCVLHKRRWPTLRPVPEGILCDKDGALKPLLTLHLLKLWTRSHRTRPAAFIAPPPSQLFTSETLPSHPQFFRLFLKFICVAWIHFYLDVSSAGVISETSRRASRSVLQPIKGDRKSQTRHLIKHELASVWTWRYQRSINCSLNR